MSAPGSSRRRHSPGGERVAWGRVFATEGTGLAYAPEKGWVPAYAGMTEDR